MIPIYSDSYSDDIAEMQRRLNRARETAARLEEQNALLLWLHAEQAHRLSKVSFVRHAGVAR